MTAKTFPPFPWTLPKYKATFLALSFWPVNELGDCCPGGGGAEEGPALLPNFVEVSSRCLYGKFSMYLLWLKSADFVTFVVASWEPQFVIAPTLEFNKYWRAFK